MKTLFRILCAGLVYCLVYFQLTGANSRPDASSGEALILLFTLSGPFLFFIGTIRKGNRFRVFSVLFLKALFTLIILYPCGNNPSLYTMLLALFCIEAVLMLDEYWPVTLVYLALILFFIGILPRRAWGRPLSVPPFALFPVLFACLSLTAVTVRQFLRTQETLTQKNNEIGQQQFLIDQVYQLNSRFQEYALNAERKSAEDERKRITRDIHDIMGYTLVNLRVMLEVALDLASGTNARLTTLLEDSIGHTRDGLQSARKALRNLRVIEDSTESWMNRMHRIAETFASATGILIHISWGNVTRTNCPKLKSAVYQFIQEALTNSFKHGKAASVEIDFRITETTPDDKFVARVIDNGTGAKEVIPGIGFSGMSERIALLEGETGYRNLDHGFEVWISIPMLSMRKET